MYVRSAGLLPLSLLLGCTADTVGVAPPAAAQRTTSPRGALADEGVTLTGSGTFGEAVTGVGDVDGDGYADVLVKSGGSAMLFRGGAAGVETTATTTLTGVGDSIAAAGDVNLDGYADVVVDSATRGEATVYLGSASGLDTSAPFTLDNGGVVRGAGDVDGDGYADVLVAGSGGVALYRGQAGGIETAALTELAGTSAPMDSAGDVNADGFADVIVTGGGGVQVVYGAAAGLDATSATTITSGDCDWGKAVAGPGDVDGDGYADVVVAANDDPSCIYYFGRFYVYPGSTAGVSTTASALFTGPTSGYNQWADSLAAMGDTDGDGYPDLLIGEPGRYENEGAIYLYTGSASGLVAGSAFGNPTGSYSGYGSVVGGAGDLDGDGFADGLAGAPGEATVYVYSGGETIPDSDGDGVLDPDDCAPTDAAVHVGAAELVDDGVDNDCDGLEACFEDGDGDGGRTMGTVVSSDLDCTDAGEAGATAEVDCNDANASVYVGAPELCDGLDDDCDGIVLKGEGDSGDAIPCDDGTGETGVETADTGGETADTGGETGDTGGETGDTDTSDPEDTADTSGESGDTGVDSGDTSEDTDTGEGGEDTGAVDSVDTGDTGDSAKSDTPACGCASAPSPSWGLLLSLALLRRRVREARPSRSVRR